METKEKYCSIKKELQENRVNVKFKGDKYQGTISGGAEFQYKIEKTEKEDKLFIYINGEWAQVDIDCFDIKDDIKGKINMLESEIKKSETIISLERLRIEFLNNEILKLL